jgi:release factor glutamine methyltransferase
LVQERLAAVSPQGENSSEADLVFKHRLGLAPTERILHARGEVGPHAVAAVEEVVSKRVSGQPLAYALGCSEFCGLTFTVTPDVLVPRLETEFLVQRGAEFLADLHRKRPTLLDLGCGSGCVGLTLAKQFPILQVTLTDVSEAAIAVARENARRLGVVDRCTFKAGDWFAAVKRRERFDAVLCNPPYVTRRDDPQLAEEVKRHEPSLALFLDQDPTEFFFRLARKTVSHLVSGGLFAVEVGYDTAWPARCGFEKVNALTRGHEVHDFSGIERVIWGIRR